MILTVDNYTFATTALDHHEITFNDYTSIDVTRVIRVYNIDKSITIYEVNPKHYISYGASASGNVFTSVLALPAQNNGDKLHIEYDDPTFDVPETLGDGRKVVTTAGTRLQLSSTPASCKGVVVTAESTNTGIIVVGGTSVIASAATRRGIPLAKGDSLSLEIDNLNKVYLDSTVSGEGVTYVMVA